MDISKLTIKDLETSFDFTTDTEGFWDSYWDKESGLGRINVDPDSRSLTMQKYMQLLYSRKLPNGEVMELKCGSDDYHYLTWKGFRFGSDSIINSFMHKGYRYMIDAVKASLDDPKQYYEDYIHKSYTVGGEIIFPKRLGSINQNRGCNKLIRDRFDLTLECIRRYYNDEWSPLSIVLQQDKAFFDLFKTFEQYVTYFFLDDLVTDDCKAVTLWIDNDNFKKDPYPATVEEYKAFIAKELEFLEKRNQRIKEFIATQV